MSSIFTRYADGFSADDFSTEETTKTEATNSPVDDTARTVSQGALTSSDSSEASSDLNDRTWTRDPFSGTTIADREENPMQNSEETNDKTWTRDPFSDTTIEEREENPVQNNEETIDPDRAPDPGYEFGYRHETNQTEESSNTETTIFDQYEQGNEYEGYDSKTWSSTSETDEVNKGESKPYKAPYYVSAVMNGIASTIILPAKIMTGIAQTVCDAFEVGTSRYEDPANRSLEAIGTYIPDAIDAIPLEPVVDAVAAIPGTIGAIPDAAPGAFVVAVKTITTASLRALTAPLTYIFAGEPLGNVVNKVKDEGLKGAVNRTVTVATVLPTVAFNSFLEAGSAALGGRSESLGSRGDCRKDYRVRAMAGAATGAVMAAVTNKAIVSRATPFSVVQMGIHYPLGLGIGDRVAGESTFSKLVSVTGGLTISGVIVYPLAQIAKELQAPPEEMLAILKKMGVVPNGLSADKIENLALTMPVDPESKGGRALLSLSPAESREFVKNLAKEMKKAVMKPYKGLKGAMPGIVISAFASAVGKLLTDDHVNSHPLLQKTKDKRQKLRAKSIQ
jgi:hypothetical protein